MENGRCRIHGGLTPKGNKWHVPNKPKKGEPLEKQRARIERRVRNEEKRLARLAALTPEERAAYDRWLRSHRPGAPEAREREREQRRRDREAGRLLRELRSSRKGAGRAALVIPVKGKPTAAGLPVADVHSQTGESFPPAEAFVERSRWRIPTEGVFE